MGGASGGTSLPALPALLCALLLLCGCSSAPTYWDVGAVPQQGPESAELPYQDGGTLSVKRSRLLALRSVVHNLARAGRVQVDHLVFTDEIGVNARAGRTGEGKAFISVTLGMLDFMADDIDEVAGIMAHEVAHLALNHAEERKTDPRAKSEALAFSRHLERKADEFGIRFAWSAGYDPEGVLRANRRIQERIARSRVPVLYGTTHPSFLEREADMFRLVSEVAAATRQSKPLQLWSRIGLAVEQQAGALVVTRLGGKTWGTLHVGDRIVSLESPVHAPVSQVDDLLRVAALGPGSQSFRFGVVRQGVSTSAHFHSGAKR